MDTSDFGDANYSQVLQSHHLKKKHKTIILGDTHGRSIWKQILSLNECDRVIFLGDYFDSFDITGIEQLHNFQEIINWKKDCGKEVILLVGNHIFWYFQ